MTQPTTVELPKPTMPMTNRVLADNPYPRQPDGRPTEPVMWTLGHQHPFVAELKIMRMYVLPGVGVEVYSAAADGKVGVRNTMTWQHVLLCEEVMDPQTFIEEITHAEEEETPEEEPEEAPEEQPAAPVTTFPGLVPMPPPTTPNGAS